MPGSGSESLLPVPHGPSAHANMLLNWFTAIGACTLPSRTRKASRREQRRGDEGAGKLGLLLVLLLLSGSMACAFVVCHGVLASFC